MDGDEGRAKRLLGAYALAAAVVAGLLTLGVVFGGRIRAQVMEEEVTVKFAPKEVAPPAPPPPPPPPPKPHRAKLGPPPPLAAKSTAPPVEIPKEKPRESDHPVDEVPFAQGDPDGCVGCTGKPGGGGAPIPSAPPPPPEPPPRTYQIVEVATPPVALTRTMPAFPEDARKSGVDAVVVVKFVVTERGEVEDIEVIEGHPALDAAVIGALRGWRFSPGTLDGKVVRVARKMKFPFHLRAGI